MKDDSKNPKGIDRRKFLPILGSGLLLPLLPAEDAESEKEDSSAYKNLLKPDGTAVRLKISSLKKSSVLKKKISTA